MSESPDVSYHRFNKAELYQAMGQLTQILRGENWEEGITNKKAVKMLTCLPLATLLARVDVIYIYI